MKRLSIWWSRSWRYVVATAIITEACLAYSAALSVELFGMSWWDALGLWHLLIGGFAAFCGGIGGLIFWADKERPLPEQETIIGLDTSHDCWHGACAAFTRWRHQLAEAAGYDIRLVIDNDYRLGRDTVMIDWGHITPANLYGEWEETPADPLLVLIAHHDDEGVLHPAQGGPLADRLEELLPALPDGTALGHIGNWRDKTRKFIAGLRAAAAADEDVEFH